MDSNISKICGESNITPNFEEIKSDPNYVFVNDPGYSTRQLFDSEGNKVFVNSFIECEHYVSGGWGFSPLKNQELFSQDLILYFIIFGIFLSFLKPKIKEYFQN